MFTAPVENLDSACVHAHTHAHTHTHTHAWQTYIFSVYHSADCAVKPSLSKERKREREDLNQDNINKPVAGREKPKQVITPGKSHCRIYIKTVYHKSSLRDL